LVISEKTGKNCFECNRCGYCCSYFGKSKTLPVFEFEIFGLIKEAKKKGITLVFVPENILLDKKSGKLFCMNYGMSVMPCPFLAKNKGVYGCSIYENRPLICRKFPLEKNPVFHGIKKHSFFDCPNLDSDKILDRLNKTDCLNNKNPKRVKEEFIGIFGKEIWKSSLNIDKIKSEISKKLKNLEKKGKTEIVSIGWIDVKSHDIIGVFEFFRQIEKRVV